jgi:protein phosphatase
MHVAWAAATHPGMRRETNEDSYSARPDLGLFVVADGMGGHVAGEVASRLAVEEIVSAVTATVGAPDTWSFGVDPVVGPGGTRLRQAFRRANQRIAVASEENATLRGMATTASALLVAANGEACLAHVGDTRIYLARRGRVERLTDDHSWVEEQVRAGTLDRRAADGHPWRNVVTRAISGGDDPLVDHRVIPLEPGDRLLISSDGLHGVLGEARVADLLDQGGDDLQALCDRLVAEANAAGGPDNITMIALAVHAA